MSADRQDKRWLAMRLPPGIRVADLFRLAVAIGVVQAAFWVVLNPVLFTRGHAPHTEYELGGWQAASLISPDAAGLAEAKFTAIEGPGWYACCDPGYQAVRFWIDIPTPPADGLGLLPQIFADNFQVLVNGHVAIQRGRMELGRNTYHANDRRIEFISAGHVRPGRNQIDYIMVRDAMPYFDLGKPIVGPWGEIENAYALQAFMLGPFLVICIVAGFVLAGFALVLVLQSENKGFALAVFLLILSWTLKAHYYSWSEPPFGGNVRLLYYFCVTSALPVAWLHFADRWTERSIAWLGPACLAALAVMSGFFAYALWFMPTGEGFDLASEALNILGSVFMGLTVLRLLWHMFRHGDQRHWEVAIFCLIALLAVLEFANEFFWQQTTGYLSRTAPFLILALVVAFFARSVRLFRSADQINQVLAGRLAQREAELSEAHARERDLVRFQAHADERQRILRDMHDGLGSQLMSMLLAARRGEVKPDRLAEGLQSVIDEMRLIIASMDSVGESLFAALSLFRDRMTPRIDAAGFTLEWDDRYRSDFPEYGPRPTLQVFRILQEAVTNALKHSGGDRVHVLIEPSHAAAGGVRITVSDNGLAARGAQAVLTGTGRGLANMQTRAAAIGARISITHSSEGVAVTLDLPPGDTSPGPRRIAA